MSAETETIARDYQRRVDSIRSQRYLNDEGRRVQMAAAFTDASAKLRSQRDAEARARETRRSDLERRLFGIDGLAPSYGDTASATIAYRDAQDRAGKVDTADEAAAMLARAERSGDEYLARAIAGRAWDMRWRDVLDTYGTTRPTAGNDLNELLASQGNPVRQMLADGLANVVIKPPELGSFTDYEVEQLAATSGASA